MIRFWEFIALRCPAAAELGRSAAEGFRVVFAVFAGYMLVAAAPQAWVAEYRRGGGEAGVRPDDHRAVWVRRGQDEKVPARLTAVPATVGGRRVLLYGFRVEDADLRAVASWPGLEQVDVIDGKGVTDKGVMALAALPGLREVVLADTAVTAAGVNAFSGHKELANLTVSNTIVENRVRSIDLKGMPKLQGLVLVCEGMTAARLTNLPKLEWVTDFPAELEEAEVSDAGRLTELEFRGTRLKKLSLSGLPKLESLDLRRTPLGGDDVASIQKSFPGVKVRR
jgi:hypothetical protein